MNGKNSNSVQAFWVALGNLSSYALTILSGAILSRYFNKTDYGTFRQISYIYGSLLVIFSAGLPRVYSYYLPRFSISEGKAIVIQISRVLFVLGAIFSLLLFLFSGVIAQLLKNEQLEYGLKVFSPVPLLLMPTLGIEGIFSSYKKTFHLAIYNTITKLLTLLFIVTPVVLFHGTFISAIYGWVIVSFLSLLLALLFRRIPYVGVEKKSSTLKYKDIFDYSLPLVAASLWGIAIKAADEFFISRYFGAKTFAEYTNGFTELPLVSMITASTSIVLMPVLSKLLSEPNNLDQIKILWKSTLLKSAYLIYPMVVFFIFNAYPVVVLLYSKAYEHSAIYFQICMVTNFFNIIIFAPLVFAMRATRFYARLHMLIAALAWSGSYLVVLIFSSPIAIALFSVFLSILKVLIALNFVAKRFKVRMIDLFPVKQSLQIIVHTSCIMLLIVSGLKFISIENYIIEFILSLCIYVVLVLSTSYFFNLEYLKFLDPIISQIRRNLKKI